MSSNNNKNVEEAKAVIWERLVETMRSGVAQMCQDKKVVFNLPAEYEENVRMHAEQLSEKIIEKMKQEPELGGLLQMFMGHPSEAMEVFARLYAKNFRECAMRNESHRENIEAIVDHSVEQVEQYIARVTRTERAIKEAIEAGEYKRAEKIIRGKMAMCPDSIDIEMLNHLFTIACLSGNADLLVETLNLAKGQPNFHIVSELINKEIITRFLNNTVAENIIVEADPLLQAGLVTGTTKFSASQEEELCDIVQKVVSQAVEKIIDQFTESNEWTRDNLLETCRNAIIKRCEVYERFLVGTKFHIQWKGEKIPNWMKGRFHQM